MCVRVCMYSPCVYVYACMAHVWPMCVRVCMYGPCVYVYACMAHVCTSMYSPCVYVYACMAHVCTCMHVQYIVSRASHIFPRMRMLLRTLYTYTLTYMYMYMYKQSQRVKIQCTIYYRETWNLTSGTRNGCISNYTVNFFACIYTLCMEQV